MKLPFYSVIIPTYNRVSFLRIAIESVLTQTYQNFELIIVDDGSSDNTKEIIEEYTKGEKGKYPIIKYFYQENKGPASARNKGLEEARGDFIAFLDSDDRFVGIKLEVTNSYIRRFPQYKVFHTEEIWYRKGKFLPQKRHHKKPQGDVFKDALKLCCISMSTAVLNKGVFEEVGMFDERMPVCEDYEFWLRVTARFSVKLINKILTIKEGGHPDQQSKKYSALDRFRIYAIKKLLDAQNLDKIQKKLAIEELKYKCEIYIKGAKKRGKWEEVQYYKNLINSLRTNG